MAESNAHEGVLPKYENGSLFMVLDEKTTGNSLNPKGDLEINFFAKVDAMLQFHHYALLIEHDNNVWDICE